MRKHFILLLLIYSSCFQNGFCQSADTVRENKVPTIMLDISYSNNYLFLNNDSKVNYSNGDILIKLKNDFEMNFMGLFTRDPQFKHNKLYGGFGINFSEYQVKRNLYTEPTGMGHFPVYYYYTPGKLEYTLNLFRINVQLDHFGLYKRILLYQKLGLAFTVFNKRSADAAHYQEQYGSSHPVQDPAHVTPDNPNGWYFNSDYTTTTKNDLDIFKNGISVFYKFGIGYRIKQFTPTAGFEFSYLSGKFGSTYLKFQVGLNYAFLKK